MFPRISCASCRSPVRRLLKCSEFVLLPLAQTPQSTWTRRILHLLAAIPNRKATSCLLESKWCRWAPVGCSIPASLSSSCRRWSCTLAWPSHAGPLGSFLFHTSSQYSSSLTWTECSSHTTSIHPTSKGTLRTLETHRTGAALRWSTILSHLGLAPLSSFARTPSRCLQAGGRFEFLWRTSLVWRCTSPDPHRTPPTPMSLSLHTANTSRTDIWRTLHSANSTVSLHCTQEFSFCSKSFCHSKLDRYPVSLFWLPQNLLECLRW